MALAVALEDMHRDLCGPSSGLCDLMKPTKGADLLQYLKKVTFKGNFFFFCLYYMFMKMFTSYKCLGGRFKLILISLFMAVAAKLLYCEKGYSLPWIFFLTLVRSDRIRRLLYPKKCRQKKLILSTTCRSPSINF